MTSPFPETRGDDYDDDSSSDVYRSDVDDRVWMCNIPAEDVATGIQASTSLRKIKAYVEQVQARNGLTGDWKVIGPDHHRHVIRDES